MKTDVPRCNVGFDFNLYPPVSAVHLPKGIKCLLEAVFELGGFRIKPHRMYGGEAECRTELMWLGLWMNVQTCEGVCACLCLTTQRVITFAYNNLRVCSTDAPKLAMIVSLKRSGSLWDLLHRKSCSACHYHAGHAMLKFTKFISLVWFLHVSQLILSQATCLFGTQFIRSFKIWVMHIWRSWRRSLFPTLSGNSFCFCTSYLRLRGSFIQFGPPQC